MYNINKDIFKRPNFSKEKDENINSAIYLNENCMNLATLNRVVQMCKNSLYYHEFKISGCLKNDRFTVLKTIFNFVDPITFSPIEFKRIGQTECKFLAKDCLEFIMKIIANKFKMFNPENPNHYMKFEIIANSIPTAKMKIDQVKDLTSNLKKRYHNQTGILNLSSFCEDDDLQTFYPLYEPKILLHVMSFSASFSPRMLILQNNHLKDANSIYPLNKTELVFLDLRNNEISSLEDLECLKHFTNLKHLLLNGNPICALYNSYNYVLDMKSLCASLEKLDNKEIQVFPSFNKNFLCNEEAEDLASQFLEHFFTVYDSDERRDLAPLYDRNAIMSVSSTMLSGQMSTDRVDLTPYGLKKPFALLGSRDIMKLFDELPETNHDPYSFSCDVLSCTKSSATICVKGMFKDRNQLLYFSRNFVLLRHREEFVITNDQLFVCNASNFQLAGSFRFPKADEMYPYFQHQYREIENALRAITGMNSNFCQRLLDICGYDLKRTLRYFSEMFKADDIPRETFLSESWNSKKHTGDNNYSEEIIKRTKESFSNVGARTVWETYNRHRLSNQRKPAKYLEDYSINRIYTKTYIGKSERAKKPEKKILPQSTTKKSENKPININLSAPKRSSHKDEARRPEEASSSRTASSGSSRKPEKPPYSKTHEKIYNVPTKESPVPSSKPNPIDIVNNIARKRRLTELKKQLEREQTLKNFLSQPVVPTSPTQKIATSSEPKVAAPVNKTVTATITQESNSVKNRGNNSGRVLPSPTLAELKANFPNKKDTQPVITKPKVGPLATQTGNLLALRAMAPTIIPTNPWESTLRLNLMGPQNSLLGPRPSILGAPPQMFGASPALLGAPPALLGVPQEIITIPDNIVGVPEILGIRPELFTSSPPVPQIKPKIPRKQMPVNNFDPDEFEPPSFATDTVENKSSKQSRDTLSPPPGVELDEYLREHEGDIGLKRKLDEKVTQNEEPSKKQKTSSQPNDSKEQRKKEDLADEKDIENFKQILQDIFNKLHSRLDLTKCQRTLDGLAKRLSLFHQHLLYNVTVDLNKIDIHVNSTEGNAKENPAKHLQIVSRAVVFIMIHEIYKKDCSPKTRMLHCFGFLHPNYAEKRRLFGICAKISERYPELVRITRQLLLDEKRLEDKTNDRVQDKLEAKKEQVEDKSNKPHDSSKVLSVSVAENTVDLTLKKYIYEVLWKMLLQTSFKPLPLLLDTQRVVLIKLTEIAVTHIQNLQKNNEVLVPDFQTLPKIKQMGLIKNLFRSLIYVISHDIYLKPPCTDSMCLKQPKKTCSPLQLPEELKIARHALASVEQILFNNLRSARKLSDEESLIKEIDVKGVKIMFPVPDPPDEELHKDMFEEDILTYVFGQNSTHFYWKIIVLILRSTYNRKLKQQFFGKTLPFLIETIDKFVRTVGNAPGADAIVLNGTEKEHLAVENEPDRVLKAVIVGMMHVITHEILETSKCQNMADINENNILLENLNRSNICQNPIYHYPDKELLSSIRKNIKKACKIDQQFSTPEECAQKDLEKDVSVSATLLLDKTHESDISEKEPKGKLPASPTEEKTILTEQEYFSETYSTTVSSETNTKSKKKVEEQISSNETENTKEITVEMTTIEKSLSDDSELEEQKSSTQEKSISNESELEERKSLNETENSTEVTVEMTTSDLEEQKSLNETENSKEIKAETTHQKNISTDFVKEKSEALKDKNVQIKRKRNDIEEQSSPTLTIHSQMEKESGSSKKQKSTATSLYKDFKIKPEHSSQEHPSISNKNPRIKHKSKSLNMKKSSEKEDSSPPDITYAQMKIETKGSKKQTSAASSLYKDFLKKIEPSQKRSSKSIKHLEMRTKLKKLTIKKSSEGEHSSSTQPEMKKELGSSEKQKFTVSSLHKDIRIKTEPGVSSQLHSSTSNKNPQIKHKLEILNIKKSSNTDHSLPISIKYSQIKIESEDSEKQKSTTSSLHKDVHIKTEPGHSSLSTKNPQIKHKKSLNIKKSSKTEHSLPISIKHLQIKKESENSEEEKSTAESLLHKDVHIKTEPGHSSQERVSTLSKNPQNKHKLKSSNIRKSSETASKKNTFTKIEPGDSTQRFVSTSTLDKIAQIPKIKIQSKSANLQIKTEQDRIKTEHIAKSLKDLHKVQIKEEILKTLRKQLLVRVERLSEQLAEKTMIQKKISEFIIPKKHSVKKELKQEKDFKVIPKKITLEEVDVKETSQSSKDEDDKSGKMEESNTNQKSDCFLKEKKDVKSVLEKRSEDLSNDERMSDERKEINLDKEISDYPLEENKSETSVIEQNTEDLKNDKRTSDSLTSCTENENTLFSGETLSEATQLLNPDQEILDLNSEEPILSTEVLENISDERNNIELNDCPLDRNKDAKSVVQQKTKDLENLKSSNTRKSLETASNKKIFSTIEPGESTQRNFSTSTFDKIAQIPKIKTQSERAANVHIKTEQDRVKTERIAKSLTDLHKVQIKEEILKTLHKQLLVRVERLSKQLAEKSMIQRENSEFIIPKKQSVEKELKQENNFKVIPKKLRLEEEDGKETSQSSQDEDDKSGKMQESNTNQKSDFSLKGKKDAKLVLEKKSDLCNNKRMSDEGKEINLDKEISLSDYSLEENKSETSVIEKPESDLCNNERMSDERKEINLDKEISLSDYSLEENKSETSVIVQNTEDLQDHKRTSETLSEATRVLNPDQEIPDLNSEEPVLSTKVMENMSDERKKIKLNDCPLEGNKDANSVLQQKTKDLENVDKKSENVLQTSQPLIKEETIKLPIIRNLKVMLKRLPLDISK